MSSLSRPTLVNKDAAVKADASAVKNRDIIAKRLTPQQMAERRIRGETESCNLLSNGKPLGQIVAITQF